MSHQFYDVIVVAVPESLVPDDTDGYVELLSALTSTAIETVTAQYGVARVLNVEWTLTNDPDRAAVWPLPCDCESCLDGRDKAVAMLRVTDDHIALGKLLVERPGRA